MGASLSGEQGDDGGFLGRWSRRKRTPIDDATRAETETAHLAPERAEQHVEDAITPEELAALPSLEEITEGTDIKPFLRLGVPQAIKNAALRRIWMLTPAIRDHRDLAVDYAWDWNTPGGLPGSSGEIGTKGITDLIARMGNGRQEEAGGAEPVEAATEARRDHDIWQKAMSAKADTPPMPDPNDEGEATTAQPRDAKFHPAQRHGSARPV